MVIFFNYLTFLTDFIPKGNVPLTTLQLFIVVSSGLVDLALIIIFVISFFESLLPKFNNWLDEKF